MNNSASGHSSGKCTVLRLHDMCHNPKFKCEKQITFTPKQIQLEGNGFKNTKKKFSRELKNCGVDLLGLD